MKRIAAFPLVVLLLAGCIETEGPASPGADGAVRLTILHANDAKSALLNAGEGREEFGGAARFTRVVADLRAAAVQRGDVPVTISAGDNIAARPELFASLENGVPFYDTFVMSRAGFDVSGLGTDDFALGPDVLADFLRGFTTAAPVFLDSNLDVTSEPVLTLLVSAERVSPLAVLRNGGTRIGVAGVTTPELPGLASPRRVRVSADLVAAVETQLAEFRRGAINKVILVTHLGESDLGPVAELVAQLDGVDVVVAGGGGETILADAGDALLPGDAPAGPYPTMLADRDGDAVPMITVGGEYGYVGQLVVEFDEEGEVVGIDEEASGPVRVAGGSNPDAVEPDADVRAVVVDPVAQYVDAMDETVLATSDVALDARAAAVRSAETNLGDLIADAYLERAAQAAGAYDAAAPDVALVSAGTIGGDEVFPAGELTRADVFAVLPSARLLAVVGDVPRAQFKELLEHAVSGGESPSSRFAQVTGFRFVWDPNGPAQTVDDAGAVTEPGSRIRRVELDDGTVIVDDGEVVDGPAIAVVTTTFLARGGERYPFRGAAYTTLGLVSGRTLEAYLSDTVDGAITAGEYPEGGEGRITRSP